MDPLPRGLFGLKRRQLFALYLLVGSAVIVVGVALYTLRITRDMEDQTRVITEVVARMASRTIFSGNLQEFEPAIRLLNAAEIPVVVTDSADRPILWNSKVIGIPPVDDLAVLLNQDPADPTDPRVAAVVELIARLDDHAQPHATYNAANQRVGTLHYGQSPLIDQVRLLPFLVLAVVVLFFLAILWGLQVKKENHQNLLFAGMAKETAHQLGTPLTSIMGWLALLQDRLPPDDETLRELEHDIGRLSKVSNRFGQIGSRPMLEDHDLVAVVDETITYFRRRLPHLGGRVELRSEGATGNPVAFNRDLMEWVLENLIKNAIDALDEGKGTVTIRLSDLPEGGVALRVRDTGRGIKPTIRTKLFEPGVSSKSRGWGMGLALVKRIVTQYHGGRIRVESTGSQGTVFLVTLPGKEV